MLLAKDHGRRVTQVAPHADAMRLELVLEQRHHVGNDDVDVHQRAIARRGPRQGEESVDDLRRAERLPLDLSSSRVCGSCGSAPSSSICVKLEIPVSGVLTSCATPAASKPIDAIFSEI